MAKRVPMRMCIGCREMKPKAELVRVVKAKGAEAEIDLTYKVEGRGAYICRNGECIANAKRRRPFERAFRGAVPQKIYDELEKLIKD